jgi:glycosyltransferase involved in cell wall biosynthesis
LLFADGYGFTCIGQSHGDEAGVQCRRARFLRILLLNQAFVPDTVASAQYAADLAKALAAAGHNVTVLTGKRGYDRPKTRYPAREIWNGVQVIRIASTGFGKTARWRRAVDFASFLASCVLRLALLPRFEMVISMTSPPLLSAIGAAMVKMKGGTLVCWVLDLNPDEAIVAGWLNPESLAGRMLGKLAAFSFRTARRCVVMDRFMADRVAAYGTARDKIVIIPPWPHDDAVRYDAGGREEFRHEHGLDGRFVVMYSGNHSPCHPMDTLLEAARRMKNDARAAFCFAGGGGEFERVKAYAAGHRLRNVLCLPYVPLARLSASLSAADLHVVVMGDAYAGIVHPSKVYNIMALGIPFLYIGPESSYITDLAGGSPPAPWMMRASHGDVDAVIEHVRRASESPATIPQATEQAVGRGFSQSAALAAFLEALELAARTDSVCTS